MRKKNRKGPRGGRTSSPARTAPKRLSFNALDRLIFVGLYRLFPVVRSALAVVRPETVVLRPNLDGCAAALREPRRGQSLYLLRGDLPPQKRPLQNTRNEPRSDSHRGRGHELRTQPKNHFSSTR